MKVGTQGTLVTADIWMKKYPGNDVLEGMVECAFMDSNIHVVNFFEHEFQPQGITMLWVLAESHCSIHAYPELNYISVDIYTCGNEGDANKAMDYIFINLEPIIKFTRNEYKRGCIGD